MPNDEQHIELIKLAQRQDAAALNQLSQLVADKLRTYIFRVTLDEELSQDLTQETLLQMVKSLCNLENPERFWPWLYRIATSKIQQHYRVQKQRAAVRTISLEDSLLEQCARHEGEEGFGSLVRQELADRIMSAMQSLTPRNRTVLCLRCFEELEYAQIAAAMDCTELNARVAFYRARTALQKQLSRRGIKHGALILALGWFARLTSPAQASMVGPVVSSAAATGSIGVTGTTIGWVGTKSGALTAVSCTLSLAMIVIYLMLTGSHLTRHDVRSVHYVMHSRNSDPGASSSLSKGAYEQWCYFPETVDGPMFFRMQRWNPSQTQKMCAWLQNADGNYYYHSGPKTVYIQNYHLFTFPPNVKQLPTDSESFRNTLLKLDETADKIDFRYDRSSGLLTRITDHRFVDAPDFSCDYQYNTLEPAFFDYGWPADVPVVDQRDEKHKRGWTWFRIDGSLSNQPIQGGGRIPFYYKYYHEYPPCLVLKIADQMHIKDTTACAVITRNHADRRYTPGTFLKGLPRPWLGLHPLDTIRRDAAAGDIPFTVTCDDNFSHAQIVFQKKETYSETQIIYFINLDDEMIESIVMKKTGGPSEQKIGELTFTCVNSAEETGCADELRREEQPSALSSLPTQAFWLMDLADGKSIN